MSRFPRQHHWCQMILNRSADGLPSLPQILNEIAQHKIRIYEFPDCDDEEEARAHRALRERVPFAVVGANTVVEVSPGGGGGQGLV